MKHIPTFYMCDGEVMAAYMEERVEGHPDVIPVETMSYFAGGSEAWIATLTLATEEQYKELSENLKYEGDI